MAALASHLIVKAVAPDDGNEPRAFDEVTYALLPAGEPWDDETFVKLVQAVRAADTSFEKAGDSATRPWLRDYLGPQLVAQGLAVVRTKP